MHEAQYAKALATTLDEALDRFGAHVKEHAPSDTWWTWLGGLDAATGELHVPPPSIPEWADAAHAGRLRAEHGEKARIVFEEFGTIEVWLQAAWERAAATFGIGGLPPPHAGDPSPAQVQAIARFRTVPVEELARWFLREARALVVRRYREVALDGSDVDAAALRLSAAHAFEAIYSAVHDGADASHLPFLRGQGLFDWPAHLVGDGPGVFYLMVDVNR
jgi:hypothetical protein